MKFYKRDPDAALSGMADLSLQERGAYNTIIDLLYSRDGALPDDDEMLRRVLGCHGNEWNRVKSKLIIKKKIWVEDGYIKAKRVDSVLKEAGNFSETQRIRAGKRWELEGKSSGKPDKSQQNQQANDAIGRNANTPIATPTPKQVAATDSKWTVRVSAALGFDFTARPPDQVIKFLASGHSLIAQGVDIDLDLIPILVERRSSGKLPSDLKSLAYFRDAALDAKAARLLVQTITEERANTPFEDTTEKGWASRMRSWLDSGFWPPQYGPRPHANACRAPKHLVTPALATWNEQGGHPAGSFPVDPMGTWTPWHQLRDLRNDPNVDYGNRQLAGAEVIPMVRRG